MRKTGFILMLTLIIFLLTLCGCKGGLREIDFSNKYVFDQDSQENCISLQSVSNLAESNDSYFYFCEENKFIYVIDKENRQCTPLCNKTNCLHDKEIAPQNCNAFLGATSENIIFYNDALYFSSTREYIDKDGVEHSINEINSISLDDSERNAVFSTEEYTIWNYKIHRDNIYADMTKISSKGQSEGKDSSLYKIPLEDSENIIEFLPYKDYSDVKGLLIIDTRFYGNNIFLLINILDENNKDKRLLINYDLQTNKWINISEELKENVTSFFTVCKENIYYGAKSKVYKCDFEGKSESCIFDSGKPEFSKFNDYIYFNPLTNDTENVIISIANDEGVSENVIFYNCDEDKTYIHKIDSETQIDVGGDKNSLINKVDSSLYFYDKNNKKQYKIYDFVC